jgi:ABC-type dipeptide/oligopeptide/nickel transport system ATPase component
VCIGGVVLTIGDTVWLDRVNVVGCSGSGKSALARRLSERLKHPYIEMDAIFWKKNWTQSSEDEFFGRLEKALSREKWVLDGNYDRTMHIKWRSVTAVIWVDYSFARTLSQAVRRTLRRAWSGAEIWPGTGNRESFFRTFFTKDSILLWTIRTHKRVRMRYEARMADPNFRHIRFIRLRSPTEANAFLDSLPRA